MVEQEIYSNFQLLFWGSIGRPRKSVNVEYYFFVVIIQKTVFRSIVVIGSF